MKRAMSGSPMRALTGSTMKKNHPAAAISRTKALAGYEEPLDPLAQRKTHYNGPRMWVYYQLAATFRL